MDSFGFIKLVIKGACIDHTLKLVSTNVSELFNSLLELYLKECDAAAQMEQRASQKLAGGHFPNMLPVALAINI